MPCGGVPHDHDLGDVAELGEILFQPVLSGLPRETADEHLSGYWIMVNGHYLFRLMVMMVMIVVMRNIFLEIGNIITYSD